MGENYSCGAMTVVIDASALFAAVLPSSAHSEWAWGAIRNQDVAAPELLSLEVTQAMRKAILRGFVDNETGWGALSLAMSHVTEFYPHQALIRGVWENRHQMSAYDASYVELARALDVPLVTLDSGLARVVHNQCKVVTPQ